MSDNSTPDTTDPATDDTTPPTDEQPQATDTAPASDEVSSNPGPWYV